MFPFYDPPGYVMVEYKRGINDFRSGFPAIVTSEHYQIGYEKAREAFNFSTTFNPEM
jgi:hypothetical protein